MTRGLAVILSVITIIRLMMVLFILRRAVQLKRAADRMLDKIP